MPHSSRAVLIAVLLATTEVSAATRTVGPGKTYAAPCAAFAAAVDGDVIEIDASGKYDGDVCGVTKNGLTIRGVSGIAKIPAAGKNAQGKGIWVVSGNDTVIENVEFSGAAVADKNGAGIRQEGKNLTVRGCSFHDNEDGILAGDNADSEILIERSIFAANGAGDGYSHNLYINHVAKLTFQFNWSHGAIAGHLLKTRARENHILYNRLSGEDGRPSYEIDVPNGGTTYVIGNLIEQGPATENGTLLAYQLEGADPKNPGTDLYVINNTFVNDKTSGSSTFVHLGVAITTPAIVQNNVFAGGGTPVAPSTATLSNNVTDAPGLVDATAFDYRLTATSPCIDAGAAPGMANGVALTPTSVYVHPASSATRATSGAVIDVGAYELDSGSAPGSDGGTTSSGGTTSTGGTASSDGGAIAPGGSSSGGSSDVGGGASTGGAGSAGRATGGSPTSGADASDVPQANDANDSSGCSCRFAAAPSPSGSAIVLALAALALRCRRSR
jgi:hypothetical protein